MARFPKPFNWKPINPKKYAGDVSKIISRSSWETRLFSYLDKNPSVLLWNSEDFIIKYISPIDGQYHNYHIDVIAKIKTKSGEEKTFAIEVKPAAQMVEPKPGPNKKSKVLLEQIETYQVNQAKWKAAKAFCEQKGISFIVLNEYDLGIEKRKSK